MKKRPPPQEVTHGRDDGEEELGAVGAGPTVGHAEGVGAVVSQRGVELVLKLPAPDALASHPRSRGVARLDHEALRGGQKKEIHEGPCKVLRLLY